MTPLDQNNGLAERVYQSILDDILDGSLVPGEHLVQEQLAACLNVSRQPVQQAMALLKADGLIEKVGRRGMAVTALDVERMQHHYDLRGLVDGYVARRAAERIKTGEIDKAHWTQVLDQVFQDWNRRGPLVPFRKLVTQDEIFHHAIYEMSGNTTVVEAVRPHWRFLRRAMVEVLRQAEPPAEIWDQHAAIAEAILAGDPETAERLAHSHTFEASIRLSTALLAQSNGSSDQKIAS